MSSSKTTPASPTVDWQPTLDAWHPSVAAAGRAAAAFVADMSAGRDPYWLTLSGVQGVGKTMLAEQVFIEARDHCNPGRGSLWLGGQGTYHASARRPRCVWFSAHRFKSAMFAGDWDLPESLREDYLVVIDDLGAARDTRDNALADGLYRLADQRVGRWMVWTTNLTLKEIAERLDPRISSRLIRGASKLVTIQATDYALRRGGSAA